MENLLKLTKKKLEELGREKGIELDRRKSKATLVEELEAYLCKCGKTEDESGFCDGSHAKTLVDLKSEEAEETLKFIPGTPPQMWNYNYKQILNAEFATEAEARIKAKEFRGRVESIKQKFVVVK
jgi:CDGSH-type Zn-finger protein